jgi:hypothetical protein
MIIDGTTYGLVDERRCRLVVVHTWRWVVRGKEGMLIVWVIVTVSA